jgi:hypothetical protein
LASGLGILLLGAACVTSFGEWPRDVAAGDDAGGDAGDEAAVDAETADAGDADDADGPDGPDADACDPEAGCCSDLDCDDGVDCTEDLCDTSTRTCSNPIGAGWCLIDGRCHTDGDLSAANPCLECRAARAAGAWTDACAGQVTETTFEDFRDGTFPRSAGDLYVSSDGSVRVIRAGDINGDGYHDIVFSNLLGGESYVYWGSSSGFSSLLRTNLPTPPTVGQAIADLNADGYLDLIFSGIGDQSYVYWGGAGGFSTSARTEVPTRLGRGVTVADLDADGYLDLVLTSLGDGSTCFTDSWVYLGGPAGFSADRRIGLATVCAHDTAAADLNGDGYLDLIFANGRYPHIERAGPSFVYWGSASGFSSAEMSELPTVEALDVNVADLDGDGWLDVVFGNRDSTTPTPPDSYIYWGSAIGLDVSRRTPLPTFQTGFVSIADLDADGRLDLVFPNIAEGADSLVYWGTTTGFSVDARLALPTRFAGGGAVADYNGDTYLDVVFGSNVDRTPGWLFWNSASGFDVAMPERLDGRVANHARDDLGNIYDRGPDETYQSGPVDIGAGHSLTRLGWSATLPLECTVRLRLRSAATTAGLGSATWHGPVEGVDWYTIPMARTNPVHAGHRYVQYQAVLSSPTRRAAPALDSVTLYFE